MVRPKNQKQWVKLRTARFLPLALILVRVALATAFLSAVADRFGLWGAAGTSNVAWGNFGAFLEYTGLLLWFLPPAAVAVCGWLATVAEITLGIGLILGYRIQWVAIASALLLALFAVSMTVSLGPEPAFSYSVWTATTAALLLACASNAPCNTND